MATENPSLRLGDLLTSANLLKPTDLREAMMIARQQQLPVGRVLIMNGYLSEGQLQSAVQAQSMIKDGIIDLDTAVEALDLVATEHITLDESLIRMGWTMNNQTITNKLGEFLVEAELVAPADIHYALEQCREIGLPLGRVLVVTGYLTEEMLTNALNAQVLVRDARLSREQAVHGLRAALERQISLEESLQQTGIVHSPNATRMRLGELLLGASVIDEANLMNAVEIGLVSEKLIGQVLVEKGTLSPENLENALILQNMVAQGELYGQDAIAALRKAIQNNISAYDALNSLHEPAPGPVPLTEPLGLYQFLQLGGLITPQDVEQAMQTSARDTNLMGQMLQFAGIMPEYMVEASKEALDLINRGSLTIEQSMIALKTCLSSGNGLQDAFRELNWEFYEGAPVAQAPQAGFEPVPMPAYDGPAMYTNQGQQFAPPQAVPQPQIQSESQPAMPMPHYQNAQQQATSAEMPSGAYRAVPHYPTASSPSAGSGGFPTVPQNHAGSGGFPTVPQNNTASGNFPPAPQNHTASGSYPPAPQNTQSGAYPAMPQPATNPFMAPLQEPFQSPQQQQLQNNQQPMPQHHNLPHPQVPPPPPQPFAQYTSGAQPPVVPAQQAPSPVPSQPDWTQSQSGAQQALVRKAQPADDTTLRSEPLAVPTQPEISVPRVDQTVNPWAAKTQAPAISAVNSAQQNALQPHPQQQPQQPQQQPQQQQAATAQFQQTTPDFAAPAPEAPAPFAAPPAMAQQNPFAAPQAQAPAPQPEPQAPVQQNPFGTPQPPATTNPFAAPAAARPNPFAAPTAPSPQENQFAAPQAPTASPQAPAQPAPQPALAPPAPPAPAPAPAEEAAPPKRKKLNDLMPKSKK